MASILNADDGVVSGSAGLKSTADSSGVLALQTNGATAVTVTAAGSVGIGTSSPTTKLHIADNGDTALTIQSITGSGQSPSIRLQRGTYGTDGFNDIRIYNTTGVLYVDNINSANEATNIFVGTPTGLGIGTSSPAYKLDLYSTVSQFTGRWGNATRAGYFYADSGGPGIFNTAAYGGEGMYFHAGSNYIQFITNSAETVRIDTSGNVGIGTTSYSARLTVNSQNATAYANTVPGQSNCTAAFTNTAGHTSGGTFVGYQFNVSGNSQNRIGYIGAITESTVSQALSLVFGASTASGDRGEKMRLDSTGNLVIGLVNENVAAANQRLLITGSPEGATLHGIFIHNNSYSAASARIALSPRYSFLYNTSPYIQAVSESTSAAALTFGTTTGGAVSERARISSDGNVSIGSTADVGYKLGIVTTSTSTPTLYLRSTASGDVGIAQLRLMKNDATNTSSQIFIQFAIDGNNTNSGQINANGASQAAFGSFSDVRLKENIENLPSQLNNIMALRPVEFDYKNGSGHQIGFIAQEMEQVYPDAIGVGDDEMLTVTGWSKTEARLVKAIQELKAEFDAYKALHP